MNPLKTNERSYRLMNGNDNLSLFCQIYASSNFDRHEEANQNVWID